MPLLVTVYFALTTSGVFVLVYILAALLPFFALFAGFALLVLQETGPFVGLLCGAVVGLLLWSALLLWLDRRRQRPLPCVKADANAPRWLRRGATEADDVGAVQAKPV